MDLLTLIVLLAAVAVGAAIASGGIGRWALGEWRAMRARSWAPGDNLDGPGTMADARVAAMVVRQRAYGRRLRRQGKTLLAGKEYVPVLTRAVPEHHDPPPRADRVVVPLRRPTKR